MHTTVIRAPLMMHNGSQVLPGASGELLAYRAVLYELLALEVPALEIFEAGFTQSRVGALYGYLLQIAPSTPPAPERTFIRATLPLFHPLEGDPQEAAALYDAASVVAHAAHREHEVRYRAPGQASEGDCVIATGMELLPALVAQPGYRHLNLWRAGNTVFLHAAGDGIEGITDQFAAEHHGSRSYDNLRILREEPSLDAVAWYLGVPAEPWRAQRPTGPVDGYVRELTEHLPFVAFLDALQPQKK